MSQVLKALEASEKSHRQFASISPLHQNRTEKAVKRSYSIAWCCVAFITPIGVVMLSGAYLSYQQQLDVVLTSKRTIERLETKESPFELTRAPKNGLLKSTVRLDQIDSAVVAADGQQGTTRSEFDASVEIAPETNSKVQRNESQSSVAQNSDTQIRDERNHSGKQSELSDLDLTQLSPELALRVQSLMDGQSEAEPNDVPSDLIKLTHNSNDYIGRMPAMNFQTHVYSSRLNKRWVKVNNQEFVEGEMVTPSVELVTILPQVVVVRFNQQLIEIPALYDWQG